MPIDSMFRNDKKKNINLMLFSEIDNFIEVYNNCTCHFRTPFIISDEKRLTQYLLWKYSVAGRGGRPVLNTTKTTVVELGLGLIQMDLDERSKVLITSMWTRLVSVNIFWSWNVWYIIWCVSRSTIYTDPKPLIKLRIQCAKQARGIHTYHCITQFQQICIILVLLHSYIWCKNVYAWICCFCRNRSSSITVITIHITNTFGPILDICTTVV